MFSWEKPLRGKLSLQPRQGCFAASSSIHTFIQNCFIIFFTFWSFTCHEVSFLPFLKFLKSPFLVSLLFLPPPPFTSGQFFNLFEQSVDIQIKPLWRQLGAMQLAVKAHNCCLVQLHSALHCGSTIAVHFEVQFRVKLYMVLCIPVGCTSFPEWD